jgi:spoIIIJ-associated protein
MGPSGSIFEGKTLDDAVRKALEVLGLSRAEVMITMLEEGSSGFLGIGARPYKVRVMPRPGGPPSEPSERGEREGRGRRDRGRERSGRGPRGARDARSGAGAATPEGGARSDERRGDRDRARADSRTERGPRESREPREPREERAPRAAAPADRGDAPPPEGDRGRRGRRGGRGRGRDSEPDRAPRPREQHPAGTVATEATEQAAVETGQRPDQDAPRVESQGPALSPAELEAQGKRWTEQLLAAMGFEATVTATAAEDRVDVTAAVSQNDELLTGRKGEVRQALQHLLNRMVNRGEGSRYHLQLEINDFWRRREEELREIARDLAERAIETGSEAVTEYLNAQERRVIHVMLRDDQRVKTYALGTGMIKRLAVAPADFPEGPRDDDQ